MNWRSAGVAAIIALLCISTLASVDITGGRGVGRRTTPALPPPGKVKAVWLYGLGQYDPYALVGELKSWRINTVFVNTDVDSIWGYVRFLKAAHESGIRVYAMILEDPTYTENHEKALSDVEKVLEFNDRSPVKFDGINIDVEPYTYYDLEEVWPDYVLLVKKIDEMVDGKTEFSADIPRWYGKDKIEDLAPHLDFFVIMAYDSGVGWKTAPSVERAVASEMAAIRAAGSRAVIGVGVHEGFRDKEEIERCLEELYRDYSGDPAFMGVSIFRYRTYFLLPGTPGGAGVVEISYPEERWPATEIDVDGNGVPDYVMEVNPWNIGKASGRAVMTYDPQTGAFSYIQDLRDIEIEEPGGYVLGFPEVYFGNKPWSGHNATDGAVHLPARVADLADFSVTLSYSLSYADGLPVNLALESWLTRDRWRSGGVRSGEVELMVWLYYDGLRPRGSKVGEITVPITVNGTPANAVFEVWRGDFGWEYIAFRIKSPIRSGNVTLPYYIFLAEAERRSRVAGFSSLFLEDVEVGTEFGSPGTKSARLSWTIHKFELAPAPSGGLIVIMYTYPDFGGDPDRDGVPNSDEVDWWFRRLVEALKEYPSVPKMVVVNPENGPGVVRDENYVKAIRWLHDAGAVVLGYVPTGYSEYNPDNPARPGRTLSEVKGDIDTWLKLYPEIDGLFVDEVPWRVTGDRGRRAMQYYISLTDYAHSRGLYPVVGNPGTVQETDAYLAKNVFDIIVVYENPGYPSPSDVEMGGDRHRKAILVHSAPPDPEEIKAHIAELRRVAYYFWIWRDDTWGCCTTAWNDRGFADFARYIAEAVSPRSVGNNTETKGGRRRFGGYWSVYINGSTLSRNRFPR